MKYAALNHGFGLYEVNYTRVASVENTTLEDKLSCVFELEIGSVDICIGEFCHKNLENYSKGKLHT